MDHRLWWTGYVPTRRLAGDPRLLACAVALLLFSSHWLVALAERSGLDPALLARVEQEHGSEARARLERWELLIEAHQNATDGKKLELVNEFFNELRFVSDKEHWGDKDYWATPVEFLSTAGGDCEDFSIAKYFTLREMGVPLERLRLTYVKAIKLDQAHMVLTYFPTPDAEPLVLDNLINEIRVASMRKDLVPVYSFNGDGLWLAKERGQGRLVGKSSRLSRWRNLVERLEGTAANKLK